MRIQFFGVRGSCPYAPPANVRYGANTAAVGVEADPDHPILLDLGTGVRQVGASGVLPEPVRATALVTHLHFDHVQGLPFFAPVHTQGTRLDIYGPPQAGGSLEAAMAALIRPPYFPVPLDEFQACLEFHDLRHGDFALGDATVTVRPVPHIGPTVGYRIECRGSSLAYLSDHQMPPNPRHVADTVLELCDHADLVIHDAQYTDEEFAAKSDWGHCTVDYAVHVANTAGARRLCLFHHDPSHDDDALDQLLEHARVLSRNAGLEVTAASEGMTLDV